MKTDRISLAEFNRLIENLGHSDFESDKKVRIALILQYYTSLRFGDCTRITFDNILNNNKFELVEEKTGKRKSITVNPKLKEEVQSYFNQLGSTITDNIISYSIQHSNRKLKAYKSIYNIKNYTEDNKFNFSTHSIRKCSLYEIYRRAGINVSLKISNHSSIEVHLRYICAEDDIKDAYLCL